MTADHPALGDLTSALGTPLPRVLRPRRTVPAEVVRPTRAEVNLAHLRHNLRIVKRTVGEVAVWAVLKADAYGHGAKAVARTLERAGVDGVGVALLEEGIELRAAGIRTPILVMGGYYGRAWGELLRHDLTPVVYHPGQVEAIAEEVRYSGSEPARVHVKIDTGMARLGARPSEIPALARAILRHPEIRLDGLMTHFACADAADPASIEQQLTLFAEVSDGLKKLGLRPTVRHAANSAALFQSPRSRLDIVRPGIALFGIEPRPGMAPELKPAMSVRSEVVALRRLERGRCVGYGSTWTAERESTIATIPLGYADGLSRGLSNHGDVLVRGRRAPIAGTVSMDLTMVDVTDVDGVRVGDECIMLGNQRGPLGEDRITASELAERLGTIPWEVLTSVMRRVPRFYREP